MKPSKAPKLIHEFLLGKGFGYEKKYKYYSAFLKGTSFTLSISFSKTEGRYEIDLGMFYPALSGGGYKLNPGEMDTLKPDGKLLMAIDFSSEIDQCWDFSDENSVLIQLNKLLPYWFRVISSSKAMIKVLDYLIGISDELSDDFKEINTQYLERKETIDRLWHKSLYAMLKGDFKLAKECIKKTPDWSQEDEDTQKVLSDCKKKKITVSDDLIKYMQEIGAKEIDLDNW